MKQQNKRKILSSAALFAAAIIWGSSFFILKNIIDVFPPNLLLGIRFGIGFLLMGVFFFKKFKLLDTSYLWRGALLGFLLFMGYYLQTLGIMDTTPGKNAFLTANYCVMVPFFFWMVDRSKPDAYNIISAFICIAGIGLISLTAKFTIGAGDALTLVSSFFYASHIVCVAKFSKSKDILLLTTLQFGFVALFAWSLGLATETFPAAITPECLGELGYLTLFATFLALLLQNIGQKFTHPAAASVILSLESVFGVLFSVIFYGEVLSMKLLLGFILVFFAVITSETKLSFLKKWKKKPPVFDEQVMDEEFTGIINEPHGK